MEFPGIQALFIDTFRDIRSAQSPEELTRILAGLGASFGLDAMVFGTPDWPSRFANTFSESWMRTYVDEDVGGYDPLVSRASARLSGATWRELHAVRPVGPTEKRVVDLCCDYGWFNGFCVPIRGPENYMALCVMAGREAAFSEEERALFELLILTAHERYREFLLPEPPRTPNLLSPREQDCISFVASGMTDAAIATRLGLSEATVRWHIDNVRRKLNAATRAQAVAQGIWRGVIQP